MNDWQEAGERHAIRNRLREGSFPAKSETARWNLACKISAAGEAFDKRNQYRKPCGTIVAIQSISAGDFGKWLEGKAA